MAISYTKTNWVNGQSPAINATNLNKIENGIFNATTEVNGKYSKPSGGIPKTDLGFSPIQIDLLWTNESPTSSFGEQTISLNLSSYDCVFVLFNHGVAKNKISSSVFVPIGQEGIGNDVNKEDSFYGFFRNFTTSSSGISFSNCEAASSGYYQASNNNYMIPVKIYGIKGVN